MSSIIGKKLKISIFGQSHSEGIGVVIDGLPAGIEIDMEEINNFMQRRAPGNADFSTKRKEADEVDFLSGIFNGKTCGAPLCAIIKNTNTRSGDYDNLKTVPRPSHADYTAHIKYGGFQDYTGGGHFSGRLTAPLCIAGAVCKKVLSNMGIDITAHIKSIKNVEDLPFYFKDIKKPTDDKFPILDEEIKKKMLSVIEDARKKGDSVGGVIECAVCGLKAGIGEPMFDGIENQISKIIFGIPAVKGIEFGSGFESTKMYGSENNDEYIIENEKIMTKTNNSGGILGGISTGMPIIFKVAIKPTPSISMEQDSVNIKEKTQEKLIINGRHDPCIVPRAVPCVEAATAIAILDILI